MMEIPLDTAWLLTVLTTGWIGKAIVFLDMADPMYYTVGAIITAVILTVVALGAVMERRTAVMVCIVYAICVGTLSMGAIGHLSRSRHVTTEYLQYGIEAAAARNRKVEILGFNIVQGEYIDLFLVDPFRPSEGRRTTRLFTVPYSDMLAKTLKEADKTRRESRGTAKMVLRQQKRGDREPQQFYRDRNLYADLDWPPPLPPKDPAQ